jgi:hypothetical protein
MLFRADVICPRCKQYHVVVVEYSTMPDASVIFRYRCPATGGLVKEALRVYEEIFAVPDDAIKGWRI